MFVKIIECVSYQLKIIYLLISYCSCLMKRGTYSVCIRTFFLFKAIHLFNLKVVFCIFVALCILCRINCFIFYDCQLVSLQKIYSKIFIVSYTNTNNVLRPQPSFHQHQPERLTDYLVDYSDLVVLVNDKATSNHTYKQLL